MSKPLVAGLIPARYGSTRLPGKALEPICGKPMIQRVYERCAACPVLSSVCVVTDDRRIVAAVEAFGGKAVMTRSDHPSGTDRLAEAAASMEADIIVNIQGDQPFIDPAMIEEAVSPVIEDGTVNLSTLMYAITREADLRDPGVVKVVADLAGNALYFSRSLIPYARNETGQRVFEHVGTYVYRRETLLELARLEPTPLEQTESLEQLRWIEHGYRIRVVESRCRDRDFAGFSVDTAEDLERAEQMLRERGLA